MDNNNFQGNIDDTKYESGRKSDNDGYTLIEVLIALAIFSIGILGVADMQILSTQYNALSRVSTEALTVGAEQMEMLMILPYDDAALDPAPASNPHTFTDGTRTVQWNVTDNLENKSINMTVTYPIPIRGVTRSITLSCVKPQDI